MAVLEAFINPSATNDENREWAKSRRAGMISTVFGCWHRNLGRPLTRDGETYRACLNCGARRQFNLATWKLNGPYYYGSTSPTNLIPGKLSSVQHKRRPWLVKNVA